MSIGGEEIEIAKGIEKKISTTESSVHIGKRPWSPHIQGQPIGPEATITEILGKGAPIIEDGKLSRRLEPEEEIRFGKRTRWSSPLVLGGADLRKTTVEEQKEERLIGERLKEALSLHEERNKKKIKGWCRRQAKKRRKNLQGTEPS